MGSRDLRVLLVVSCLLLKLVIVIMHATRAQHVSLANILALPNPTIDLKLEEFEKTSQKFLAAVNDYTSRAIEEILRRKDAEASRIQKDGERKRALELEITEYKEKEVQLLKGL